MPRRSNPSSLDLLKDLNPSQQLAVQHLEGPLLILAGPGSGKTRVITRRVAYLIQQGARPEQILAITFTNKAAGEMKQRVEAILPNSRVWISTFHSFGARILRQHGEEFGLAKNFTIYDQGDRVKIVKAALEAANLDNVRYTPDSLMGAISKAKNQLLGPEKYASQAKDFFQQTVAHVYPIYEKKMRDSNALDFDDLLYWPALILKNNAEFRANLDARFRYVLIDEYQDTNQAQYDIARALSVDQPNLCVVGDPDQCLPPGTLIETPKGPCPVEKIREGDFVLSGSGWGDVAPMPVNKVMVNPYRGKLVRIQVEGGVVLRATPNHVCFALIQSTPNLHFTYLMWKRGVGYRIGTTRGVRSSKDGIIVSGLQVRANQEVADAIWILRSCSTPAEARYYEHFYAIRYGIPTMVFFVRGRRMEMTQEWIDRLYQEVDTEAGATKLMGDLHLDPRFPHHRPGGVTRGLLARRHVLFTMFGDNRLTKLQKWHYHRIQLVTTGEELRVQAAKKFTVRDGQKGTWRVETSRKVYGDAVALAEEICQLKDTDMISRARLTPKTTFIFLPASHIHPGMLVPVLVNGRVVERKVESVEWEDYEGLVYDLSVPNTHNYCANNLLVHNSIYKFRGSDIRNILNFERDFPDARVITLDRNYRSTNSILQAASHVIAHNKERKPKALTTENPGGEPVTVLRFESGLEEADGIALRIKKAVKEGKHHYRDFAIFLRINALTRTLETAFLKHQIPFQIVRGFACYDRKENRDVVAYLRLLLNPRDDLSFLRAVNEPARGVGKVSLEKLQEYAEPREIGLLEAAEQVQKITTIKGKAARGLHEFAQIMADLHPYLDQSPEEVLRQILDRSGYRKMLQSGEEEDLERLANVEEFITAAKQFTKEDPSRTVADFVESIALVSDQDAYDEHQDSVSVMTLHASKGLEFPVVFMVAVEQGLLPHERSLQNDKELEEERRLAFVGMTRAKEELYLTHARLREFRGQTLYAVPSMFLEELPPEGINDVDESSSSAQRNRFMNDWRGGSPTADKGWIDAGILLDKGKSGKSDSEGPQYKVGMFVEHDSYGPGKVTSVDGVGAMQKVKVRFGSAGERTFLVRLARLTIVEGT
jgi:DNA helicase-2/ATP-dependent DNA helicase PcrA